MTPIFLAEIKKVAFSTETNDVAYKNTLLEILYNCSVKFDNKVAKSILEFLKDLIVFNKIDERYFILYIRSA